MRLWSLHPKYLDSKGLVAVWREGLLAQKVLLGETKGYKNHPQLVRFKNHKRSLDLMCRYLSFIWAEGMRREYKFNCSKILGKPNNIKKIEITRGQLLYEFIHLQKKLKIRDKDHRERNILSVSWCIPFWRIQLEPHPLFKVVEGDIEKWEKI